MRARNTMIAVATAMAAAAGMAGDSAPFALDTAEGPRVAAATETLRYSTAWAAGAPAGAVAEVAVNGETVSSSFGSGSVQWTPPSAGLYTLTHKVTASGVQYGDMLTATFKNTGTVAGILSQTNQVVRKTVDFDSPKVVTFFYDDISFGDENGGCRFEAGCSVDGIELDGSGDDFGAWLSIWNGSGDFNEWGSRERKIYVPAGRHVIRWEICDMEIWWGNPGFSFAIAGYTETDLVRKESLYDWGKTFAEDEVWLPDNLDYLLGCQSAAISANPADYETRINRALTKLLLLGENATLRELLGRFGFTIPDFYIHEPQGEFCGLARAPSSTNVVDTVLSEVLAMIDDALSDIEAIPENWTGSIELNPAKYSGLDESVFLDRAEVQAVRGTLRAARAFALLVQGYDFELDYFAVSNAWDGCATTENLLASMPKAGRVKDFAKLAAAKEDFRTALDCLKKTDAAIVARTDSLTHFLEYDEADARDIEETRTLLDKATASLDATNTVDITYALTQSPLNKSPLSEGDLPGGFVRQVYLGAIFAGAITRDLLPSFEYGVEKDDDPQYGDFLPIYFDTLQDPTFGGLLPDLTVEEVVETYSGDKWYTAAGYMRDRPEMKLSEGHALTLAGTATTDGLLSFVPTVDGWVEVFVEEDGDLYLADDGEIAAGELYEFDIVQGSKYRAVFSPAVDIADAAMPVDLISIPEPLPNGGPYTEIVDGVEWMFVIENGMATLGDGFGTAVASSTTGALCVPNMLGGHPVAAVEEGAFAWCASVTSIEFPATVASIGAEAFYKCNALTSLTFPGDEPSQVADDAFSKMPTSAKMYTTRASSWSVPIPGTWKGHAISYVAGVDPRIEVTAEVEDGTEFEGVQDVSLSAPPGKTVYYTTDGTSPVTSPTRIAYTGEFQITETTTFRYCAIDDETGDWSSIQTVTYTAIVKQPDGGPYRETIEGVTWEFTVQDNETWLNGIVEPTESLPRTLAIPSRLGGWPVVQLNQFMITVPTAPDILADVRKVTIPDSVKRIMSAGMSFIPYANSGAAMAISSGILADTNSYPGFVAIDGWIVERRWDPNTMMAARLPQKVDLESARGIAEGVLVCDDGVEELSLPATLTRITSGILAVSSSSSLRKLKIPDSVTSIDSTCFVGFHGTVGAPPCCDFTSLPGFIIVDGWIIKQRGDADYSSLPMTLDMSYFRGIADGVTLWSQVSCTLILPSALRALGTKSGNTVESISISMPLLSNVYVPYGIANIGTGAFSSCSALREVYIPASVTAIGENAFQYCSSLSVLYLPESLRGRVDAVMVAQNAAPDFHLEYYSGDEYPHAVTFDACGGSVSEPSRTVLRGMPSGYLPTPVRDGFSFAGWYTQSLGGKEIDRTVRVLEDMTLYAHWESAYKVVLASDGRLVLSELLEKPVGAVTLPHIVDGFGPVEVIGRDLMRGATEVTSISFPMTITVIEPSAFRECSRLESVELPEGLREISDNAFRECVSLKSITIPATVTNIGYFAFRDCLRLETVNLLGDPPRRDLGVFMGVPAFTTVSGRLGSSTAIVYAVVTNSTPEITVPDGWLDELVAARDNPAGAESYKAAFVEKFGSDLSAALVKPTGKHDLKGNPMYVWQDYVAGTDPLDEEDQFTATITMEDGMPVVRWSPELPAGKAVLRKYTTYGATALGGNWVDVSDMSDAERHAAGYQFFQVSVELKR